MRIPRTPPDLIDVFRSIGEDWRRLQDPEYAEFARLAESRYWPWDKIRIIGRGKGVDPELAWALIKIGRTQRYRTLALRGHGDCPLKYNIPDQVQRELMMVDRELAGRLATSEEAPLSTSQRDRFIISALREEAIASSMLEGAATTRSEAKDMLRTGRKPRSRGEQMVLNNYHAIQFIRENKNVDLSTDFLLELQQILTEKTLDSESEVGRLRWDDDEIVVRDQRDNEILHRPPPAGELTERLIELCRFANDRGDEKGFTHPVVKACVLHFQIGFDHPFCDGNGRTARAIFYWYMLRQGYWLFEFLPISRLIYRAPIKYARAFLFSEHDEFDVTYFLNYHASIIGKARKELREYITAKQNRLQMARRLYSSDRRLNSRQREVVLQATRNPSRFFSIADHQIRHNVAYDTARNDLLKLAEWGYLDQHKFGRRYEFLPSRKIANMAQG